MKQDKQKTGFKFGKHRLELIDTCGSLIHKGRLYRLVKVRTHDRLDYFALRLYNDKGKFIKQFLFEPEIREAIALLINTPL